MADAKEWRAKLEITDAHKLTDEERWAIMNWLHAQARNIGNDEYGRNLAPRYTARLLRPKKV